MLQSGDCTNHTSSAGTCSCLWDFIHDSYASRMCNSERLKLLALCRPPSLEASILIVIVYFVPVWWESLCGIWYSDGGWFKMHSEIVPLSLYHTYQARAELALFNGIALFIALAIHIVNLYYL